MSTMKVYSRNELLTVLTADGVPVDDTAGDDRVVFPVSSETFESTVILVWPDDVALLQLFVPLPRVVVAPDVFAPLSEAAARLNHLCVLPGFGLDAEGAWAYFRSVGVRDPDGGMTIEALKRQVQAAVSTAARFEDVLAQVSAGELPPHQVGAHAD